MRSLGERLNLLRKLIKIQCGPGAAVLPPDVSRIHLDFAFTMKGGHMGPRQSNHGKLTPCGRKFWRECLPRLKFHNPSVPMIVNRHDQNQNPATMTIYFRKPDVPAEPDAPTQPASSRTNLSKAQAPNSDERAVRIDMTNKHSSHILDFFMAETRAIALQPTVEQIAEMQSLEALRKQAATDRERVRLLRAEKKKEEDMLKRARAAGGMAEQEEA
ncbi:putative 54S ribosomal protein [Escovopsis weberi]|uniref:Putative 54S ribosomal protein n=1 Tax=Escovopsis weberi TaxID=150374 RepID=A0A0M9VX31_ESCWE|nr:putative 54S ribosomal protein [Escovopsis weberi]